MKDNKFEFLDGECPSKADLLYYHQLKSSPTYRGDADWPDPLTKSVTEYPDNPFSSPDVWNDLIDNF